jgi:hypothetical protein
LRQIEALETELKSAEANEGRTRSTDVIGGERKESGVSQRAMRRREGVGNEPRRSEVTEAAESETNAAREAAGRGAGQVRPSGEEATDYHQNFIAIASRAGERLLRDRANVSKVDGTKFGISLDC